MPTYDYDLISIGSGPAGQRAAVQAAKFGKRVAVVEKRRYVGGVSVDTGTIPSKTLREAVIAYTGYGHRFIPQLVDDLASEEDHRWSARHRGPNSDRAVVRAWSPRQSRVFQHSACTSPTLSKLLCTVSVCICWRYNNQTRVR